MYLSLDRMSTALRIIALELFKPSDQQEAILTVSHLTFILTQMITFALISLASVHAKKAVRDNSF